MSVPSESLIRWVLFRLMATSVPVLYFMFGVGGFLPLADDALKGVMAGNFVIAVTSHTSANPEAGAR
jgi:hypothetical protein